MVDVHVIHLPGERSDWWEECERSLYGQQVVVHHVDGVRGDVRRGRFNGYNMGAHEYVSFVDPDDRVMPGAFAALCASLDVEHDCVGAYSLSNEIDEGGNIIGLTHPFREYDRAYLTYNIAEIHQLVVMRRDVVLREMRDNWDVIPPVGYAEITTFALMARAHDWKAVDYVGYDWRKHSRGAHLAVPGGRSAVKKTLHEIYESIVDDRRQ